jgi:hypothetical protein
MFEPYAGGMNTRTARRWAGMLAITAVALCLSACFPSQTPPPGSRESLAELEDRIRELPGVSSVEASLGPVDAKDRPNDWRAWVRVTASGTDLELAEALREAAVTGVRGAALTATLELPAGAGVAATLVEVMDAGEVEIAETLRRLPQVAAVTLTPLSRSVELKRQASFSEAVAVVRPMVGSGSIPLSRDGVSISVTDLQPGVALLDLLESLSSDPEVSQLHFASGPSRERPWLSVTTDDVGRIAEILAATPDENADTRLAARVEFHARSGDFEDRVTGWLGLPLGSSEPDDLPSQIPQPSSPPDLTAEAAGATAFLEESILVASGGAAEVDSREEPCVTGSGTQVRAFALVPLSSLSDDVEGAFERVTAHWTEMNLEPYDRAMGTDIWRAAAPRMDLVRFASIRGIGEGLSLSVTSACAT